MKILTTDVWRPAEKRHKIVGKYCLENKCWYCVVCERRLGTRAAYAGFTLMWHRNYMRDGSVWQGPVIHRKCGACGFLKRGRRERKTMEELRKTSPHSIAQMKPCERCGKLEWVSPRPTEPLEGSKAWEKWMKEKEGRITK